jgi:DNA-binding transcriptional ArsR family regulator
LSSITAVPDYELADLLVISSPAELKAIAHPLRGQILGLLTERAATVNELAEVVQRPPGTVAHHVGVLRDSGLLRVVRTRMVRAVEERFYGRTARIYYVGKIDPARAKDLTNYLAVAAEESVAAHHGDQLRAIMQSVRLPNERAEQFWHRVFALTREFAQLPREGDTTFTFVAGLYPSTRPSLPPSSEPEQ